jgi:diguanylate cyclase (GGDEF)-like protein
MSDPSDPRTPALIVRALPVAVVDRDGHIRLAGGKDGGGIAGHVSDALVGQCLFDLVHPHDLVAVLDHFVDVRDHGVPLVEVDARVRGPEGAYRDMTMAFHATPGSSDVLVWCHDVTARVMVEEALRTSALHSALVEQSRALLAVLEVDGSVRYLNPAAMDMFEDACRETGVVPTITSLVHPDDVSLVTARFADALAAPRRRVECDVRIRRGELWRTVQVELVNLVEDPAVRGVVADCIDVTEQLDLAHRALHDPLTGVANRVLLNDRLALASARLARTGRPLMVAYVDLDRFKSINDTLGHEIGDAILIEVAKRLTASVRPGDTVARLGGDEFVIVCPDLPEPSLADDLADRLIEAVSEPIDLGIERRVVTASVGVLLVDEPVEPNEALTAADAAMYRAKRAGGNFGVRTRR